MDKQTGDKIKQAIGGGELPKGYLGLDQIDWGGDAGKCYECWKCEPCCGKPCNPKDALYCLACFYCCGACTAAKACSYTLDQDCSIVNHYLPVCCGCLHCCPCVIRHNYRKKAGVSGNIIGDWVCRSCCGCCAGLQELRSMPKEGWDWLQLAKDKKIAVKQPEFKIMA